MYAIWLAALAVLSASWIEASPSIRGGKVQYNAGDDVIITCVGDKEMEWSSDIVPQVAQDDNNLKITSGMDGTSHVTTYTYTKATYTATGRYFCSYKDEPQSKTSVYIFVYAKYHVFRYYSKAEYENQEATMFVKVKLGNNGTSLVPCLGTHRDVNASLVHLAGGGEPPEPVIAATYDPRYGFNAYARDLYNDTPEVFLCQGRVLRREGKDTETRFILSFKEGSASDVGPVTSAIGIKYVGDDVTIRCEVIDDGSCPTVLWTHNNTAGTDRIDVNHESKCVHFAKSGYYLSIMTLKISDAKMSDSNSHGVDYRCTATYTSGQPISAGHPVEIVDKPAKSDADTDAKDVKRGLGTFRISKFTV